MTAPSNSTRAKAQARTAADKAAEATSAASEAAQEATEAAKSGIRAGWAAVRNNEEVRNLTNGTRQFLKAAENPMLVAATVANPVIGVAATGIVKGSRLLAAGLRDAGRPAEATQESTDSATA